MFHLLSGLVSELMRKDEVSGRYHTMNMRAISATGRFVTDMNALQFSIVILGLDAAGKTVREAASKLL